MGDINIGSIQNTSHISIKNHTSQAAAGKTEINQTDYYLSGSKIASDLLSPGKASQLRAEITEARECGLKKWEFDTGGRISSTPVIGNDGTVYCGNDDGKLFAVDPDTGDKKWEYNVGMRVTASPLMANDGSILCVFNNSASNRGKQVHAIDPETGEQKWSFEVPGDPSCPPIVSADGTIFYATFKAGLHAVDGATGTEKWAFKGSFLNRFEGVVSTQPVLGNDGTLFFGNDKKRIYAVDSNTGKKKWVQNISGGIESPLSVSPKGSLTFAGYDYCVKCLDGKSGKPLWEFQTGNSVRAKQAFNSDGDVFVGNNEDKLFVLDGKTGEKKFGVDGIDASAKNSISFSPEGHIGVTTVNSHILLCDQKTGDKILEIPAAYGAGSPIFGKDGSLTFGSKDGTIRSVIYDQKIIKEKIHDKFLMRSSETMSGEETADSSDGRTGSEADNKIEIKDNTVRIGGVELERRKAAFPE